METQVVEQIKPKYKLRDNLTDKELCQAEKDFVSLDPLLLVEFDFLMIKTKKGEIKILKPNSVQKIVLGIIRKFIKDKKPIRLLILKARQMGISTLIEAIYYAYTSQQNGINTLVVADDIKGSNYIFEMQKMFHEFMEAKNRHLVTRIKHSNEKKLEFAKIHSQVLIDTAENPNVGRKFTIQYVHLSEAAFFPKLNDIMLGLSQSVPNTKESMIILESTANGVGNDFYTRWCEAVEKKSDWTPIFIPWFELPEYSMKVEKEMYPIENLKCDKVAFLKEERELKEKFKLSDEQLNWRRWCIVNNCNGEINKFRQEYPSSWQEAFIMSGDLYFDRDALLEQEERAIRAKNFKKDDGTVVTFPKVGDIVKFEGKYIFRECEEGRFRLYEYPKKDDQYAIGADSAEGLAHGDDSAMVVLNKNTNRTSCAYNCQCDTDEFAEDLIKAGNFFNMAMIAPENKGYGTAVCKKVFNHYGNIFRKIRDKSGNVDVTDELGWNTNSSTRPAMLAQLKEEVREGSTDIIDAEILAEMRTFINNPKKKRPEAEANKKDDLVVARAIAGMVRHYYPNVSRRSIEEARANSMHSTPPKVNQGYSFRGA